MFGKIGATVCITFIVLALVEISSVSANPIIGKKSNFISLLIVISNRLQNECGKIVAI